jgi:hypothetical protein
VPLAALGFDADAGGRAALDPGGSEVGASDVDVESPVGFETDGGVETEAPVPVGLPSDDPSGALLSDALLLDALPPDALPPDARCSDAPFPDSPFLGTRSWDEPESSEAGDVEEDAGTVESSDIGGGGIVPKGGHSNLSMPDAA